MKLIQLIYKKLLFAVWLFLFLLNTGYGQEQQSEPELQVQVGENILLGGAVSGEQLIEPHIAAHPSDPNHLIAVGWVYPTSGNRGDTDVERCRSFASDDGGQTWKQNELSGQGCADPWITLTENGAILTALGTNQLLPGQPRSQLLAYFSSDGGNNWSEVPQSLGFQHDGPRSVADADGTVYIVSSQFLSDSGKPRFPVYIGRSESGIQYIEKMTRIFPSNLNLNADGITTLSDGSVVVIYQDYQRPVDGFRMGDSGPRGILKTRREWAIISSDGAETFSIPKLITESCYDRAGDLSADTASNAYRDRLYVVCSGNDYKSILIIWSSDRGEEWSDAMPVELPDSLTGVRREPHVAVNRDGIVMVAWMDSRDDPSGKCYTPYVSVSSNGGQAFSDATKVGNKLSCPDPSVAGDIVPGRWPTGGDYFGLTAAADGQFHLLWSDARSGKFELRTAAISVNSFE